MLMSRQRSLSLDDDPFSEHNRNERTPMSEQTSNVHTDTMTAEIRIIPSLAVTDHISSAFDKIIGAAALLAIPGLETLGGLALDEWTSQSVAFAYLGLTIFAVSVLVFIVIIGSISMMFMHGQAADIPNWHLSISKRLKRRGLVRCDTALDSEIMENGKFKIQVSDPSRLVEAGADAAKELRECMLDTVMTESAFRGLATNLRAHKYSTPPNWWVTVCNDGQPQISSEGMATIELIYKIPTTLALACTWARWIRRAIRLFPWAILSLLISHSLAALRGAVLGMKIMVVIIVCIGMIPMLILSVQLLPIPAILDKIYYNVKLRKLGDM
jgi:hypothetical protein